MSFTRLSFRSITLLGLSLFTTWLTPSVGHTQTPGAMVYDGFTEPYYDINVAATEIGRIESVDVKEGDRITKGQLIARLEDAMQVASVNIAVLQAEMTGEIEAAKAEAFLHRSRTLQIRELAKENMVRPDELLRAEADLQIAEARQKTAMEQDRLRDLELQRYQLQVERRKVRSPMEGIVAKVFHRPGEYITPSDPAVIRLLVTDQLYAIFNVPAEEIQNMSIGTEVRVFIRSCAKTINASVEGLSPSIDGESGTIQVRVVLPNQDGELRAGARCTMQIAPNKRSARLPTVPAKRTDAKDTSLGAEIR